MEHNSQCNYDWVKVFDSDGSLKKRICGYLQQDLVLYSTNNTINLHFNSDNTINGAGFLASWTQVSDEVDENAPVAPSDEGYVLSFPQSFVVGPEVVPEEVCLQTLNLKTDGKVAISLFAKNEIVANNASTSIEVDVLEGDEEIRCHKIQLPEDFSDAYAVVGIKGSIGGYEILSYKSVRAIKSTPLGLIQTDKYDYRPKQDVYVRILLMNDALKPSQVESIDEMWVEDPAGNRLHQWKEVALKKGLAQVKFALSDEPELGKWVVKSKFGLNGTSELKAHFEVNEASLPSYEVTIKAPDFVLKNSVEESVTVCANYTHGGKVKGQANVTLSTTFKANYWRAKAQITKVNRVVEIDGCTEITFNATEMEKINEKSTPLKIEVIVKEEATAEKQSNTVENIKVKNTPFKIESGSSPNAHILNGFPYVGQAKVLNHDNLPRAGEKLNVCARLYTSKSQMKDFVIRKSNEVYNWNEEQFFEFAKEVEKIKFATICSEQVSDAQGVLNYAVNFDNLVIPTNVKKLSFEVNSIDSPDNDETKMKQPVLIHDVTLTHTNSSSAITVQPSTSKLACGSNSLTTYITGPAGSDIELSHFISSGGKMLSSGTTTVSMGSNNEATNYIGDAVNIEFDPIESREDVETIILKKQVLTIDVNTDNIKLLAYVRDPSTGETLHAFEEFESEDCSVVDKPEMSFSQEKARPGDAITIQLSGPSEGLCGYSIVDKSVALVPNPNKVTSAKVKKLRDDFNKRRVVNDKVRGDKCQGGTLLFKAFERLGLFVLSDRLRSETSCDALVDATNSTNRDNNGPQASVDYDYSDSPQPVAFSAEADSTELRGDGPPIVLAQEQSVAFGAPPPGAGLSNRISEVSAQKNSGAPSKGPEEIEVPQIDLRSYFPETWLFDLADLDSSGQYSWEVNAPHTVTTWIGDAFCTSAATGLTVADQTSLKVDQDFFIDMKLPYSIKRDELLPLNVTAFNKLSQRSLPLTIKIVESSEYKVSESEQQVCIEPQDSQTIASKIKLKELNEVNITVEASIESMDDCGSVDSGENGISDTIQKPIQVKPEGFPVEKVKSEFLCRKSVDPASSIDLGELTLPADDLVEGSARAWVTVSGDILAPSMANLEKLVKMPYGCGEQNMISMVPNIYVTKYLKGTGQNKPELLAKAKKFMKAGYKRQDDNYRHPDGSYSIWGPRDEEAEGSVWLTAFVLKAFRQAANYIDIDERKLEQTYLWLQRKQNQTTGCFKTEGFVVHSSLAKDSDAALTASLVISVSETSEKNMFPIPTEPLNKALECLDQNLLKSELFTGNDLYTKTLTAYAFALENKTKESNELLDKLLDAANDQESGKLSWRTNPDVALGYTSQDIEIGAYNVLTLIKHNRLSEALKVIKWLATQRNSYGGFKSTQDTMIALQAFAEYSLKITEEDNNLEVKMNAGKESFDFEVNEENELLLQKQKLVLDSNQDSVKAEVNGEGCFVVQSMLRLVFLNYLIIITYKS